MKKLIKKILNSLPRSLRLRIKYFRVFGRFPFVARGFYFNEIILSKIINREADEYYYLADKLQVRDFISKKIGKQFLVPLIAVFDSWEDFCKYEIPDGVVIKSNHGAGMVLVIDEIQDWDRNDINNEVKRWLNFDFGKFTGETHYSFIEKKILIEKKITPSGMIPRDYKFHCFKKGDNFEFVLQLVDGRFGVESRGYYLNGFDKCIFHHGAGAHYLIQQEIDMLIKLVDENKKIMGNEFSYLRIDWYIINKKPYLGELTLTPGCGLSNEFGDDLEKIMAKMWKHATTDLS